MQLSTDQEITQGWGKNQLKGLEVTVSGAYPGLRIVPVPTSQSGKPRDSWKIRCNTQSGHASPGSFHGDSYMRKLNLQLG